MKVSRLGIKMYEMTDQLPDGDILGGIGYAVNALRVELNKIAEILDLIDERIKAITKERIENGDD